MFDAVNLGLFVVASIALLVAPGPAVLYIVARSLDQGRTAGLVSVAGVALGSLFHVVAAALGVSALLMSSATAFRVVKYVGAAYLIYLGIRRLAGGGAVTGAEAEPTVLRRVFTQGVMVNVLNPKIALFFFAFLPQFVSPDTGSITAQVLALGFLFVLMGLISDAVYAVLAGTLGTAMRRRAWVGRLQRYVGGGTLLGLGVLAAFGGSDGSSFSSMMNSADLASVRLVAG